MKCSVAIFLSLFLVTNIFGGNVVQKKIELLKLDESEPLFNYQVPYVTDLCIDKEGSVFILDGHTRQVIKLSQKLKLVKIFGKKGQGPGEFNRSFKISADKSGNIFLVENMLKIIMYSNDGVFKKEKRLSVFTPGIFGKVIDYPIFVGQKLIKDYKYILQVFDIEAKKILKEHKIVESPNYAINTGSGYIAPAIPYVGGHSFFEVNGDYCLIGEGEKFNVRLLDKKGNQIFAITKNKSPLKLKDKERKLLVNKVLQILPGNRDLKKVERLISYYEVKNFIHKLLISEKYIFIFIVPGDISVQGIFPVEIYNFQGKMIRKLNFPKVPNKISNDIAYIVEKKFVDDEEEIRIAKYKMNLSKYF